MSLFSKIKRTLAYHYYQKKNNWHFPSNMAHLTGANMARGLHEPDVSEAITQCLSKGSTFIDVGANVGYFVCKAASKVKDKGDIYAFEVGYDNFLSLYKNTSSIENVVPLLYAVADENTFLEINQSNHSSGHSIIDTGNRLNGSTFKVASMKLDYFWRTYLDKNPIDLIKIDVEGAELHVLNGMEKILKNDAVDNVIIEFCPKIILSADQDPSKYYTKLSDNFSISIIEEDSHLKELQLNEINSEQDFNELTDYLLNLDDVSHVNFLCQPK